MHDANYRYSLQLNNNEISPRTLAQFVIEEMVSDKLSYVNEDYQKIYNEFLDALENDLILNDQHFINNPDQNINSIVVDLTTSRDHLSENWIKKHKKTLKA